MKKAEFVEANYCDLCRSSTSEKIDGVNKKLSYLIGICVTTLLAITGYLMTQVFHLPSVAQAIIK